MEPRSVGNRTLSGTAISERFLHLEENASERSRATGSTLCPDAALGGREGGP
jgi:hypothetical protein